MQVIHTRPPLIFHLLIALSLLVGFFAVIREWLEPEPQLKPFTLVLENPLYSMPDYSDITHVPWRKDLFFKTLLPLVLYENERIHWQREQLMTAKQLLERGQTLVGKDLQEVIEIVHYYGLEWPLTEKEWGILDKRVHQVPVDLVLMQAANESAWGTSRFAREGNNLFGQWCFSKGCGLVPSGREAGKNHEVRKFTTILESVQAYMRNINTHRAYRELRTLRKKRVDAGEKVSGIDLAPGLINYSERGQAYVKELINMMKSNAPFVDQAMREVGLPFLNQ